MAVVQRGLFGLLKAKSQVVVGLHCELKFTWGCVELGRVVLVPVRNGYGLESCRVSVLCEYLLVSVFTSIRGG